MTAPLSKQNEAIEFTTISADSIRNLKLVGWLLVIGNLIILLLIIILESRFADAAMKYSFFTLMYITALICTIFALKDSNNIMLYPILVTTIAFVIIFLSAWIFVSFSKLYCSNYNNSYPLFTYRENFRISTVAFLPLIFFPDVKCLGKGRAISECEVYWDISPLQSTLLLLVTFEKFFEFIFFRRLMKIFELQQCKNIHFCATEISKAFSTRNDTDDEIIVYERVTKECQNGHTNYAIKPTPYSINSIHIP